MWIVFRKSDKQVVGTTADAERDLKKKDAIAEVVSGLIESGPVSGFDAVQIKDRGKARKLIVAASRGRAVIKDSAAGPEVAVAEPEAQSLRLTVTNADPGLTAASVAA